MDISNFEAKLGILMAQNNDLEIYNTTNYSLEFVGLNLVGAELVSSPTHMLG